MASRFAERPEVELGDLPVAKVAHRRRWTIGRFMTDLGIVIVAVPLGLDWIAPLPRGGCGMTPEFYAASLGLTILAVRALLLVPKAFNGVDERSLAARSSSRSQPKPNPLDDL
jgi:hypothetical protein